MHIQNLSGTLKWFIPPLDFFAAFSVTLLSERKSFKCLSPQLALLLELLSALVRNIFCCFWNVLHFSSCYEREENRQWFDPIRSVRGNRFDDTELT